jgi:DNA-binding transcriptional ArsR family regulator
MSTADLFSALGDETRLAVLARLGEGPLSIVRLNAGHAISRQALTKHLRVLEKAGLVHHARAGRESLWSLRRQRLDEARLYLEQMSWQWDERLERLEALLRLPERP